MAHCNSMDHKIFRRAVKLLSQRFTVYCPDTRDHGKSEKVKELHYADMAEDMAQFIKVLELRNPVFYGFSDGGITGLLLAASHPELLPAGKYRIIQGEKEIETYNAWNGQRAGYRVL